jgi:hypothetical protein
VIVARVGCAVSFRIELYDALGSSQDRIDQAQARLTAAAGNASSAASGASAEPVALNEGNVFADEAPLKFKSFVVRQVVPIKWKLKRNSFRKADEFECTVPVSALPFPHAAVRVISCVAAVRHVDAISWAQGLLDGGTGAGGALMSQPDVGVGDDRDTFSGICHRIKGSADGEKVPSVTLSFRDYVGVLVSKKVPVGAHFDEDLPISRSVEKFLKGSPGEGMTVVWVDPAQEPSLGKYRPSLTKNKKGKSKKAASPKENYLDAISRTCFALGVVPRVMGLRLELAFAGTMYSGEDRGGDLAATLILGNVVEKIGSDHSLLGVDTKAVQVISFDPDTHRQHTARWPMLPGGATSKTLGPNELAALRPVAANVGLPGFEQLDESVLLVEVSPVKNPELLHKVAQAIFLERTRQRVSFTITTHSPWSDPSSSDQSPGDILSLHAGDNVKLMVGLSDSGSAANDVRAMLGELGVENTIAAMVNAGVSAESARGLALAIETIPRSDRLRVDEVEISGGEDDAEMIITLVNFTVIISDLEKKAGGANLDEITSNLKRDAAIIRSLSEEDAKKVYQDARRLVRDNDLDPSAEANGLKAIDALERETMKGRP